MKNYLDYLENGSKINWFLRPIDVNKHPVKSSWISMLSDLFKKSENDNEKNNAKNNKTISDNFSKPRNNRVVHINIDNGTNNQGTVGNVRYRVTTEYNS